MKYSIKPTSKFQKDLKRIQKRGYDLSLLSDVIKKLSNGESLPLKYRDHNLIGNFCGCRECHITPDWLLIFEIYEKDLYLYLTRSGSHSDLFSKYNPLLFCSMIHAKKARYTPLMHTLPFYTFFIPNIYPHTKAAWPRRGSPRGNFGLRRL